MIISVLIIAYHTLLDTLRSHIQCNMDLAVIRPGSRQNPQLYGI